MLIGCPGFNDMATTAESLIDKTRELVSLPNIYLRLRAIVNDVRSSNRDVSVLISEDASLTARILRIANSSFYGFPSKIDTITRAVTVIGTRQIIDVVMATTVLDVFDGVPKDKINMQSFWRHSIACGVAARVFSTYRREVNVERFFVTGLLHDIGQLIMILGMGDEYWQVIKHAEDNDLLLNLVEKEELGFDHAEVGALLLTKWELPKHMIDAVHNHHQPVNNGSLVIDAVVVHVAEVVSSAIHAAEGHRNTVAPLSGEGWDALGLPVSILTPAVAQIQRQYVDALDLIIPGKGEDDYACAQ